MSTAHATLLAEIATANRILAHHGVVDAFGHVSVRHPEKPDHFLLARSMAPGTVTADDIMVFGPGSEAVNGDERRPYLERYIHGEIYLARPDAISIVHSHSPSMVPFGVVPSVKLRPVFHMSGFLGKGAPVFEIRCCAGDDSDLLIRNRALGAALAKSLGEDTTVLMRGHGSTVVGGSLHEAVYRAIYAEVNAKIQATSMQLGDVTYLTEGEAQAAMTTNRGQLARAWNLWTSQIGT